MPKDSKSTVLVVSALHARTNFAGLLRQIEANRISIIIEKRGAPKAILMSIRDYVRLPAPEREVLEIIGEESRNKGTDAISSRQIDRIIRAARAKR